jgi:ribosomal subunit interface protein
MTISVSGKHMDVGDSLRSHVISHLEKLSEHYMHEKPEVHCAFSKSHHLFSIELFVHFSHHFVIHCKAHHQDPYQGFTLALKKLENRVKKYKARLRDKARHSHPKQEDYTLANHYIVDQHQEDTGEDVPLVIADMMTEIPNMNVGEAVMRLDLTSLPVLVFKNSGSGHLNVVYRRHDGHIGWIDPQSI